MSTSETILSCMMSDHTFADAVFANAEKALAEYNLPADVMAQFKGLSRADFEALAAQAPEERKSLATQMGAPSGRLFVATDVGVY